LGRRGLTALAGALALAYGVRSSRQPRKLVQAVIANEPVHPQPLVATQKAGMDVTEWLVWFLDCLGRAIGRANELTAGVLVKETFWRHLRQKSIDVNERQKKIINRLLDGFAGKLTNEKWGKLARISHDTALRDIQDLIAKRILKQEEGGGRSTACALIREQAG
jgi:Fic family protein